MVVGVMDEGDQLGTVVCDTSWDSVVPRSLGSRGNKEVLLTRVPRRGAGSDHDIAGDALPIRTEGYEVGALGFV